MQVTPLFMASLNANERLVRAMFEHWRPSYKSADVRPFIGAHPQYH